MFALGIRQDFFTDRVVRCWHRLPRAVEPLEVTLKGSEGV